MSLEHFEKYRSHHYGIVAAVFNRQASFLSGVAVENRRHICGHTISENALTDELQRLAELRASGALTESEFEQAKAKLLSEKTLPRPREPHDLPDHSVGRAANRYVTFQMVMAVIVILIFLFVIAPKMCSASNSLFGPSMPFQSR